MKSIKKKYFQTLLILGAILFAAFVYQKYRIAPSIAFDQLNLSHLNGAETDLKDYYGKNIFISMWAPWCRDCIKEMPDLQYVKDQLKDDNFVFLAISDYDIEKEKAFAQKMPYDFVYLHMEQKLKSIGVHAIPTNYIINSKGKIVYEKVGAEPNWRSAETISRIKSLVH